MGHAKNVLAGEEVGSQVNKRLVEIGEKSLLYKYNSQK